MCGVMAQTAETQIDKWKLFQNDLKYYNSYQIMIKLVTTNSDYKYPYFSGSATRATYTTHLTAFQYFSTAVIWLETGILCFLSETKSPITSPTSQPQERAREAEQTGSLPRLEDVGAPSLFAEQITSGVTFEMYYLGTTKLTAPSSPTKSQHLHLCREVMSRIKMPPGELQPLTPISVFISTRTLQLLDPASGTPMVKHLLPSISYISDIGNNLVIMARNGEQSTNGLVVCLFVCLFVCCCLRCIVTVIFTQFHTF